MSEVSVQAVAYEVTAYPHHDVNRHLWTLRVEQRGEDSWAVLHGPYCWNRRTRKWDYEPLPSSRTEAFKRTHRFPLDQALDIARQQAPLITVMGKTAVQAAAEPQP